MIKIATGKLTRTLALLSAGAMLGVFLLAPLSVGASHDDGEKLGRAYTPPAIFVLESTSGQNFTFQLVENGGGEMEFVHVPPTTPVIDNGDYDDD